MKVGDKVKIIENPKLLNSFVGRIGKITAMSTNPDFHVRVLLDGDLKSMSFSRTELQIISSIPSSKPSFAKLCLSRIYSFFTKRSN